MKRSDLLLLELTRAGISGLPVSDLSAEPEEWNAAFLQADLHKLLPLALDTVASSPNFLQMRISWQMAHKDDANPGLDYAALSQNAVTQACRQVIQENEFLNLILELREAGLEPLVLKGPVCRALYPKPLLRPSVDDDLLIPSEQAAAFHSFLLNHNLTPDAPDYDPDTDWELSYHRLDSPLYVEVHKCLFDPAAPAFRGWNSFFKDAAARAVPVQIQDVTLKTMHPTDHLLFLILHAFKHFLFSGFGIRIVSDVALFARAYGEEIDFSYLAEACRELRCLEFTAAVFRIADKYLGIPAPTAFSDIETDEGPLLADVLDAGIHGQDINRLHSANITLQTVAAERSGDGTRKGSLRASLFPSAKTLEKRYPFLERRPWLLPVAWTRRVGSYLKDRKVGEGAVRPTASLRIGRERVALLEQYNIIDKK